MLKLLINSLTTVKIPVITYKKRLIIKNTLINRCGLKKCRNLKLGGKAVYKRKSISRFESVPCFHRIHHLYFFSVFSVFNDRLWRRFVGYKVSADYVSA